MHSSCDTTPINTKTYPCFLSIEGSYGNFTSCVHSFVIGRCSWCYNSWPTPSLCHHWDLETYLWCHKGKGSWHTRKGRGAGGGVVVCFQVSFLPCESWSEPPADSEFLSFFVLYSRLLADFLSHLAKWVKLMKFEAENEFFCTWKVEKPQSTSSTP